MQGKHIMCHAFAQATAAPPPTGRRKHHMLPQRHLAGSKLENFGLSGTCLSEARSERYTISSSRTTTRLACRAALRSFACSGASGSLQQHSMFSPSKQ